MPDLNTSIDPVDVRTCNLCGYASNGTGTRIRDRYGNNLQHSVCEKCGLSYFRTRPSGEWYREFYTSGMYRDLIGWHRGKAFDWQAHENDQWEYAARLSSWLSGRWKGPVLHVGADPESPDPIAKLFMARFGSRCDWSSDWKATQEAQNGLYSLCLCCRTLDHLLDIKGFLEAVRGFLEPGGLFYGDILDTTKVPEFKIDHPYQLTPATMKLYLRQAEMTLLDSTEAIDANHWSFLCRVP